MCVRRGGGTGRGKRRVFAETQLFGKPPSSYRWPASRIRQATAVMSAAPLPLPSSDWRKVTSHLGDSCFTVSCMMVEKLWGTGRGGKRSRLSSPRAGGASPAGSKPLHAYHHRCLQGRKMDGESHQVGGIGERRHQKAEVSLLQLPS